MPGTSNPRVRYFDERGEDRQEEFDLVVLSVGIRPGASVAELGERLGIRRNPFGFCETDRLGGGGGGGAGGGGGGGGGGGAGEPGAGAGGGALYRRGAVARDARQRPSAARARYDV